ncbi:preprotein translocase subunit SecA [Candidatus Dojkabacteria bacterium]|nr:preprotein translocase subunit SecA [Candidatus Dojkabacteria bacterium]
MLKFLSKLFDSNEKQISKIQPIIDQINQLEPNYAKMTDEELAQQTEIFRKQLSKELGFDYEKLGLQRERENLNDAEKEKQLETEKSALEQIMPEAFALVREASKRVAAHRHYEVQLMGGYFLFQNNVTELFTGEGKTLAANLPLYLYALTGKGAHLVTVNDYLARRDAEWNGHILNSLGLTVGVVNNDSQYRFITDEEARKLKPDEADRLLAERDKLIQEAGSMKYDFMLGVNLIECSKKEAYACDVVYGTANEFGFDYLRDNMVRDLDDMVQGPLHFVIVDEADSILIDEARTPLIISQSAAPSNDLYQRFASLAEQLSEGSDYTVDEKAKAVVLSDDGVDHAEKILNTQNLYENAQFAYHLENALKAKELYEKDDEYIIRDGEVLIVDQFTGRVMQGRRYSEGLHQAIEAKEGVEIKRESKTIATITLQNYFRMYDFASGMTATAMTEAEEFANIYNLDVIEVPTNKPVIRKDHPDVVYRTQEAKYNAIVEDVKERNEEGQPVLLGTTSVEKSELLSEMLKKEGIKHNVLNAKYHEKEAKIVSEAGQEGMVTIATNMAGRGTDIALGKGVEDLGGLYVIGSERHEARRIDNQLRGRSGRQGQKGESRFYVSFEDDLMRIFGGDSIGLVMSRVGMEDDMPIASSVLGRTIETAQKRVESHHYDIRKRLVEFDDVLNQQREIIYGMRKRILRLVSGKSDGESSEKDSPDQKKIAKTIASKIEDVDFELIANNLERFTINNPDTYNIESLDDFENVNTPINAYILKKVVDQIQYILAAQLADDMETDNREERKVVSQIQAMLSDDLCDVTAKILGFKDSLEFFKAWDEIERPSEKESMLVKFGITALIFHVQMMGVDAMREIGVGLILQAIDHFWMEHLDTLSDLREGISLRNLANRDPLIEYKNEGFALFDSMLSSIDSTIVNRFFKIRIARKDESASVDMEVNMDKFQEVKPDAQSAFGNKSKSPQASQAEPAAKLPGLRKIRGFKNSAGADKRPGNVGGPKTVVNKEEKVGRNDPCPCGSGKKYKKCCLNK